jgi:hypothetical protein
VQYTDRVQPDPHETIQRFRRLDELYELTVAMRREALRRQFPEESNEAIEKRLRDWLLGPEGQQPDPRSKG